MSDFLEKLPTYVEWGEAIDPLKPHDYCHFIQISVFSSLRTLWNTDIENCMLYFIQSLEILWISLFFLLEILHDVLFAACILINILWTCFSRFISFIRLLLTVLCDNVNSWHCFVLKEVRYFDSKVGLKNITFKNIFRFPWKLYVLTA